MVVGRRRKTTKTLSLVTPRVTLTPYYLTNLLVPTALVRMLCFSVTVFTRHHVSRVSLAQPTSPCRVRLSLRRHRLLSPPGCLMAHCALMLPPSLSRRLRPLRVHVSLPTRLTPSLPSPVTSPPAALTPPPRPRLAPFVRFTCRPPPSSVRSTCTVRMYVIQI